LTFSPEAVEEKDGYYERGFSAKRTSRLVLIKSLAGMKAVSRPLVAAPTTRVQFSSCQIDADAASARAIARTSVAAVRVEVTTSDGGGRGGDPSVSEGERGAARVWLPRPRRSQRSPARGRSHP
jgi:hypothetical protein